LSKDGIILLQSVFIEETEKKLYHINSKYAKSEKDLLKMKKKRNRAYIIGAGSTIIGIVSTFFFML